MNSSRRPPFPLPMLLLTLILFMLAVFYTLGKYRGFFCRLTYGLWLDRGVGMRCYDKNKLYIEPEWDRLRYFP